MPGLAVILPAAGASTRFGANKLAADLGGQSVLDRTCDVFERRPDVLGLYLAGTRLGGESRKRHWCLGGPSRGHSVRLALDHVPAEVEWVAVHDAARPLVSQEIITRTLAAAVEHGAAVPALPVALTIKRAIGPLPARVVETVPRKELWAVQTPQIMRRQDLMNAFARCPIPLEQVTDDVQLLELIGLPVQLVEGEERNLKITTPLDLRVAELLLEGA